MQTNRVCYCLCTPSLFLFFSFHAFFPFANVAFVKHIFIISVNSEAETEKRFLAPAQNVTRCEMDAVHRPHRPHTDLVSVTFSIILCTQNDMKISVYSMCKQSLNATVKWLHWMIFGEQLIYGCTDNFSSSHRFVDAETRTRLETKACLA